MALRILGTIVVLCGALAAAAAPATGVTLRADPEHSTAAFSIKHFVMASVRGTVKVVSVDVTLQPNSTLPAAVDARLDVSGIDTGERDRDADLRSAEWFDVARYPSMHFTSTRVEPGRNGATFRVTGTLALHGVNKEITLDVIAGAATRDERGAAHTRYVATTSFDRRAFGIDVPAKTMRGNLFIGTNVAVTIVLDMVEAG
jgi:polyisoprenoid-binding protein YceI